MGKLKDQIVADITAAMKEKNNTKRDTLRVIKGEIERNEQTKDGKVDLADGDVVKIIKKSIEGIRETSNNQNEIAILESYLPKQLNETEMRSIVKDIIAGGVPANMRDVMGQFNSMYNGQADGKVLSGIIKEEITK